jgi:CBS-domain-containing membrane protein
VNVPRREVTPLRTGMSIGEAVALVRDSGLPALPVVGDDERYRGIFGEREFLSALFPGYVSELGYAGFVPDSMDAALDSRAACRNEQVEKWMNTEHIDVPSDASNVALAETFLHHRVLIVPLCDRGRLKGIVTRSEFFATVADRFLGR